jgi:methylmalonyl-CoA mutase
VRAARRAATATNAGGGNVEDTVYKPRHRVRFVTAASLFDGHDASINIMRRLLQGCGVEVIHLGHNRSAGMIVDAAIQEDVQAIAISSYQGGHMEFFKYVVDLLKERGADHILVFGGGGGVIVPREIEALQAAGVAAIYSPEDGRRLGLQGMINDMVRRADHLTPTARAKAYAASGGGPIPDKQTLAEIITELEHAVDAGEEPTHLRQMLGAACATGQAVVGVTGTGGAGKSSLTDELVLRFLRDFPERTVAVLSIDPSRQKTGGALLGDRIRMNSIFHPRVYMRSLATRQSGSEITAVLPDALQAVRASGYDLIFVETSGIGQGDAAIAGIADVSLYVMTSEFGAPSQLEKIDMLDFADIVAINKFDRRGSEDALRDVRKQIQRNRGRFSEPPAAMPVFGTIASQFHDIGVNTLYNALITLVRDRCQVGWTSHVHYETGLPVRHPIIPSERTEYLRDVARTLRDYHRHVARQADLASALYRLEGARATLALRQSPELSTLDEAIAAVTLELDQAALGLLRAFPEQVARYRADDFVTEVRGKEVRTPLYFKSLSGLSVPKVALPNVRDYGDQLRFLLLENVPGAFPFTAGVFPLKRTDEEPRRQFAGEGTPERTNARFHYLSKDDRAKRLSTAFDSVTLYGEDPDYRPDIYGKVGESGVSICCLDDMEKLYAGFDLCDPLTSVSMTINGPAPIILAMFLNAAINQQLRAFEQRTGGSPDAAERSDIAARTLASVRGTVQADILKEDQGQNTCIFSTEFALRMMGDVQQYFIDHGVRNYYSVSISGYHIAEAGANPISQLAFTLSNAFTYVEYYLARGMHIDDFAPNLSFFFSNGMDPEYTVLGRVARRIWAIAMRERYGANERSQKLKYHIQTSGRSLHAQEVDFNDIRTTLQALLAIYDNCNSLHTNAYDEAITTPTEESVRRAMAIQMIINREFGLTKNENPLQGAYIVDELTQLVEAAVLEEFVRISDRGGVLGAMETQYQRGKIQEESLYYETLKHSGELPIVGVNTFLNPHADDRDFATPELKLARATVEEKEQQIEAVRRFKEQHNEASGAALRRLQQVAQEGGNIFAELMETVKVATLGEISGALYEVGGQYRRNM